MEYRAAVAEIRRLEVEIEQSEQQLNDAKYEQAALIHEQLSGDVTQGQLAADTGIERTRISRLFRIWERWGGSPAISRPTFTAAYDEIQGRTAQVEEHGSRTTAETMRHARNMPPEQKAKLIQELISDPETPDVPDRVIRDPHTRRQLTDARQRFAQQVEDDAEARTDADPTSRQIRDAARSLNVEAAISKARFWLAEATRLLQDMDDRPAELMERLGADVDEVDLAIGWLKTAIEGGQVSDDALARLLEGGA